MEDNASFRFRSCLESLRVFWDNLGMLVVCGDSQDFFVKSKIMRMLCPAMHGSVEGKFTTRVQKDPRAKGGQIETER